MFTARSAQGEGCRVPLHVPALERGFGRAGMTRPPLRSGEEAETQLVRAWRLPAATHRPSGTGWGVGSPSPSSISPSCCPGCPSLGCHLAWLVCVALLRDSLGKVWRGILRIQETPSPDSTSPWAWVKMRAEGASTWPTPVTQTPEASQTHGGLRWDLQGMRLCSIHTPGLLYGSSLVGLGGEPRLCGPGEEERGERGTSSLLSESDDPPDLQPPTHTRAHVHT